MNFQEFLTEEKEDNVSEEVLPEPEELDIQKAVVEELAADKARLDIQLEEMQHKIADLEKQVSEKEAEITALKSQVEELKSKLFSEQERQFEEQSRNPNALALLDRDVELPDRFPGETRDHVLEVIKEAREKAEAEGRVRRAQLLESVLVANEPDGSLAQKRTNLEKFFAENGNILSGPVIEELNRCGIPYKKGEEFLLTSEILKRTY
jgi:chromosome segregation ATPase